MGGHRPPLQLSCGNTDPVIRSRENSICSLNNRKLPVISWLQLHFQRAVVGDNLRCVAAEIGRQNSLAQQIQEQVKRIVVELAKVRQTEPMPHGKSRLRVQNSQCLVMRGGGKLLLFSSSIDDSA